MNRLTGWGLAAALATTAVAAPAKTDNTPGALATADRVVPGGRLVLENLYQREIKASIFVTPVGYGGAYGGAYGGYYYTWPFDEDNLNIIATRMQAKAEVDASTVRRSLDGFDVDALAMAATRSALAKPTWFQANAITGSTDVFLISKSDFLAQHVAPQIVFVRYQYDLSPDFTKIRVLAMISIERQPLGADGKPTGKPVAIYRQNIMSMAQLRTSSYEVRDNAKRWAADGGKLARAGLTAAFAQFEQLIPYALELDQAQITAFNDKKNPSPKMQAGGYYGPLITRNPAAPDEMTIWCNGIVHVQPVG